MIFRPNIFRVFPLAVLISASLGFGEGIPVTSELVRNACGSCHAVDDDQKMSRISYMRKAPEGWQLTLKRMIRTGNVNLTPEQAREVVRYLSDNHGLAPAEARPAFYRAERRPTVETEENKAVEVTCMRCHLGARFKTQRRTPEEWDLLKGMHIGYFPVIESQTFRGPRAGELPPGMSAEDIPDGDGWIVERVLSDLAKRFPLETPEWRAFQAKGPTRSIEGRWLLESHLPGKGDVSGELNVSADGEGYRTEATVFLPDGTTAERSGQGVLYGGYTWRGRSDGGTLGSLREVLMMADDGLTMSGRAFFGAFGELGVDVKFSRLGADPKITHIVPRALASTETGAQQLIVHGANLPLNPAPSDISLGRGIEIQSVESLNGNQWKLEVSVASDAAVGYRDLTFGSTHSSDVFAIYDAVDYVKVLPDEALARVGGESAPKQLAQFEAVAYHRGPDDESFTEDDLNLGTVPANWSIEEYHGRQEDDDVAFVGEIDANGLFTPAIDGPNTSRDREADNMGDVWVVASHLANDGEAPLRGRSRLVVTIPIYVFWDLFP